MSTPPDAPGVDFWSAETASGSPESWSFVGLDGLTRLSGASVYTAPHAESFRARLVRVQLDHVAVEAFAATPHRAVRGPRQIDEHPTPLLTFVHVVEGALSIDVAGSVFVLNADEATVLDSRDPVTLAATAAVRVLRSSVGIEHVPEYLRRRGTTIAAPLARTALSESFVSFASALLRSSAAGLPARGQQLIRATADLQNAVLDEAQRGADRASGPARLRERMEEYIETHLTDPDLGPVVLAEALGVSVRYAHVVFNDGARTIGRHIRERRLARIALTLRTSSDPVDLSGLAVQYDFSSTHAMSRAFREQYGMAPTAYRADGHRSFG
ncbi:helix-turn-helix domain-containing protein [Amnibacterium kyonggiense]